MYLCTEIEVLGCSGSSILDGHTGRTQIETGMGERVYSRPTQTQNAQIFIFWGRGVLKTNIAEILEWGHSRNFEPKILPTGMCNASQIASHILRMWRLITGYIASWQHILFIPSRG